jgi:hypothetical protein
MMPMLTVHFCFTKPDNAVILSGVCGSDIVRMSKNEIQFSFKNSITLDVSKNPETNKIESVNCAVVASPQFIHKDNIALAAHLLQLAAIPQLFGSVKDAVSMTESLRSASVKINRVIDLVDQVSQIQRRFLTESVPASENKPPTLKLFFSSWKTKSKFALEMIFDREACPFNPCHLNVELIFGSVDQHAIQNVIQKVGDAQSFDSLKQVALGLKKLVDTPQQPQQPQQE